jgi:hypothetical protein
MHDRDESLAPLLTTTTAGAIARWVNSGADFDPRAPLRFGRRIRQERQPLADGGIAQAGERLLGRPVEEEDAKARGEGEPAGEGGPVSGGVRIRSTRPSSHALG